MTNTKLKSGILLTITLIIGILIGFLAKSWIVEHSFEKFNRLRNEKGFLNEIEENLKLSADQKVKLEPILSEFQKKMSQHAEASRTQFHSLIDSLKNEMKLVLNDLQYQELLKNRLFIPRDRFRGRSPFGKKPDSLIQTPPTIKDDSDSLRDN